MLQLTQLWVYPIKSLQGISLQESEVDHLGLKWDRRWMIVDEENECITQRNHPFLNQFKTTFTSNGLQVVNQSNDESISFRLDEHSEVKRLVKIWDDECLCYEVSQKTSQWFTRQLGVKCHFVFFPNEEKRLVNKKHVLSNELTSLTDGYPYLIISEGSMNDLNSKLDKPISVQRFRPNFVYNNQTQFHEDKLKEFSIGDVVFKAVKPCDRCIVTTIDLTSSKPGKEPLKTLSTYRKVNNKILFGQNLIKLKGNRVKVGDLIDLEPRL